MTRGKIVIVALGFCFLFVMPPGCTENHDAAQEGDIVKVKSFPLPSLSEASAIRIDREWSGLGTPWKVIYAIGRNSDNFSVHANFIVKYYTNCPYITTEKRKFPLKMVADFLQRLSEAPFHEGEYKPYFDHTDDFPSIKIEIELQKEQVTFFTESQGPQPTPWGLIFKGKSYVVSSPIPAEALDKRKRSINRIFT